ncbi:MULTISPECIES: GIY-YIG nuclease family protein [unclassified Burkholderia]|uniref:GIY-YIG nuclease family protein n=1 Tax=unclassified Burkholderia TaxID=2613784 RepID=UPI00141E8059|nr:MULTISPECIES: GIY-YIG nuclease family protein [unclassified Burkholderia]NIE57526.1 GIY-YIG nuclease family protein [Burkholderia sp. Ap-955]NIF09723.1 GIY-YIG nuclease family protein [Burkholderia sp. Ax-1735]NIG07136.1 GIY-YIG nuclease family protein [Burkholderia sp. Tr-849]
MSWFLYLIECADDSVYTGITTDVAARFDEHASGKGARYTRSRKPRAVLASFPLPDRSSASRAEYWVKRLTAVQKRELAAGLRTLESVLPAVVAVDTSGDAAGSKAGARGRKKAKNVDSAEKTVETGKSPKKAGKAEKVDKPAKAAKPPKATKSAPVAKRKKPDSDAIARKTSSRDTPVKKDKPAAPFSSKGKAQAASGKPVTNGRENTAPAPARRRPSATQAAEAPEAPVAPRRAKRTKDAPSTATSPAAVPVSAHKRPQRTKQNRAAS